MRPEGWCVGISGEGPARVATMPDLTALERQLTVPIDELMPLVLEQLLQSVAALV